MSSIDNFLSDVYGKDFNRALIAPAVDDNCAVWPEDLKELPFTEGDVENFEVVNGKVYHKPQPPERERIQGIAI